MPNFKRIKLTISHEGRPGLKMMPVSLSTAFQPLPPDSLEYMQTEVSSTLENRSQLGGMYSLGLYGRDFALDEDDSSVDSCCIQ